MPFDVTMPDGTMIQGVPDGTTKAQLAQKYQSHIGSAPAVPAPEGAAPADYANATDPTKTWLSQHPEQAGSLSHVASSAIEGFKNAYGDAPSAAPIPEWISKYVPPAIPVAAAYQLGNMGLRALGATPGLLQGAVKGQAEVMGFDPTQAYQAGQAAGGMPEAIAGVAHTLPPVVRNPVMPSTVNEPFFGTALNTEQNANKIANLLKGTITETLGKTVRADIDAAKEAHDTAAAALADAQRVPTPTSIGIGEPKEMTELGTPAKTGGVDAKQAMVDAQHQMDSVLRPIQNSIVADNEAKGMKFVDTPAIQELITKIEPIVKPNVTTASATTNVTDPLTKSLYRRVYNSLISKEVELTPEEAASAKANNLPVQEITDPVTGQTTYKRTFDSSFQAAEN